MVSMDRGVIIFGPTSPGKSQWLSKTIRMITTKAEELKKDLGCEINIKLSDTIVSSISSYFQAGEIILRLKEELIIKYWQRLNHLAKIASVFVKTKTNKCFFAWLKDAFRELLGVKRCNATNDYLIHKCFCIVKQATKKCKSNNDTDIDEYKTHFPFIEAIYKERQVEKCLKVLIFIMLFLSCLQHVQDVHNHKSAELKKYLSLKYGYDNAILHLLWCSGDVEVNPGPSFSKPKYLPDSQIYRRWQHEMCSTALKLLKGFKEYSTPKNLWKEPPQKWPKEQRFYDPRNKSRGCNDDNKSDENLLKCLLECCEENKTKIHSRYQQEIEAWKNKNKPSLFELYVCRQNVDEIIKATQYLLRYKLYPKLKDKLSKINVVVNFDGVVTKANPSWICKAEIIRDLAVMFCKICKKLPPHEKTDGIWITPPEGWDKKQSFYSPHDAGKRQTKGQDGNLLDNLYTYYREHKLSAEYLEMYKPVISDCVDMYHAWKQNDKILTKLHIVHANTAAIYYSLKRLEIEGYLKKHYMIVKLKEIGITLTTSQSTSEKEGSDESLQKAFDVKGKKPEKRKRGQENDVENSNKRRKREAKHQSTSDETLQHNGQVLLQELDFLHADIPTTFTYLAPEASSTDPSGYSVIKDVPYTPRPLNGSKSTTIIEHTMSNSDDLNKSVHEMATEIDQLPIEPTEENLPIPVLTCDEIDQYLASFRSGNNGRAIVIDKEEELFEDIDNC